MVTLASDTAATVAYSRGIQEPALGGDRRAYAAYVLT
jgi:hypothetical protein